MSERKLTRDFTSEFPSNANSEKVVRTRNTEGNTEGNTEPPKKKKVQPVVKGKVMRKKKSLGKKISEAFLGDDTRSVGEYLMQDILVPAFKGTLSDLVGGGIDMWLFGERRNRGGYYGRDRGRSFTSYGTYYGRERDNKDKGRGSDRRELSRDARARHDFDDIVLETKGEAEDVLSHLVDLTIDYGMASVADYYDLLNIESSYVDQNYGWTNLRDAYTDRVRQGYLIRLPQAKYLN